MSGNTPNNPTKMPKASESVPGAKGVSKPMKPMGKAGKTTMGKNPPKSKRGVSPKAQSQTVQGGPKK